MEVTEQKKVRGGNFSLCGAIFPTTSMEVKSFDGQVFPSSFLCVHLHKLLYFLAKKLIVYRLKTNIVLLSRTNCIMTFTFFIAILTSLPPDKYSEFHTAFYLSLSQDGEWWLGDEWDYCILKVYKVDVIV